MPNRRPILARSALVAALGVLVASVAGLVALVDTAVIGPAVERASGDPVGLAMIALVLLAAFSARALAWARLLPGLGFGQALAAIHVALGANHILPFRLGEPLRVVSVVRRGGIGLGPAVSTAVVLRSADIVSLLLLGLLTGPRLVVPLLGWWGLVAASAIGVVGLAALVVQGRLPGAQAVTVARPGPAGLALTAGAWLLEAAVVWRVAGWFGVQLSPTESVLVLAAAVGAQVLAITPAGIGTYEAAATAALVAVGEPLGTAVAVAVMLHGVKTLYSLVAGAIAVVRPRPGLAGRLRLPPDRPSLPAPSLPAPSPRATIAVSTSGDRGRPIVLFLPACNEGPRVAAVVAAAPAEVDGHRVEVVVIDDGSTDDTAARARAVGAAVVAHPSRLGLGAAVRTGLAEGVARGAAAVAFCDADGEYDPRELPDLVRPILAGRSHYVVGSRFGGRIDRMHPHRRLGNRLLTRWVRSTVRQPVTDGQSGFRALSSSAAAAAELVHDYNYAQVLTVDLVAKGYGYDEVPISYHFRRSGRSFIRLGPYLANVVPAVWRALNRTDPNPEPTAPITFTTRTESPPWPTQTGDVPVPLP